MQRDTLTVYFIELIDAKGDCMFDTKICFDSVIRAIGRGRKLKKEHHAARVRVENGDNGKTYWF